MTDTKPGLQSCPTRIDGAAALFAHKVTQAQCQERQRGQYHKCFTCVFNNSYVAKHGPPAVPTSATKSPNGVRAG